MLNPITLAAASGSTLACEIDRQPVPTYSPLCSIFLQPSATDLKEA